MHQMALQKVSNSNSQKYTLHIEVHSATKCKGACTTEMYKTKDDILLYKTSTSLSCYNC